MADSPDSKANLIVNYLPQKMSDEEFHSMFLSIGPLKSWKVMRDKETSVSYGFGFVEYKNEEDANRAIQTLNGMQIDTKRIKVAFAQKSEEDSIEPNVYIRNLPKHYTEKELNEVFEPFGTIVKSRVLIDLKTKESKTVGFVLFEKKSEADKAIAEWNNKAPPGGNLPLQLKYADDSSKKAAKQQSQPYQNNMSWGGPQGTSLGPRFPSPGPGGPMRNNPVGNRFRYNPMGSSGGQMGSSGSLMGSGGGLMGSGGGLMGSGGGPGNDPLGYGSNNFGSGSSHMGPGGGLMGSGGGGSLLGPGGGSVGSGGSLMGSRGGPIRGTSGPMGYGGSSSSGYGGSRGMGFGGSSMGPGPGGLMGSGSMGARASRPMPVNNYNNSNYGNQDGSPMPTERAIQDGCYVIFVHNIGTDAIESELWALFSPFGTVDKVSVVWDNEKNQCKGFGFVMMKHLQEAQSAISSLNGYYYKSKSLAVSFKK